MEDINNFGAVYTLHGKPLNLWTVDLEMFYLNTMEQLFLFIELFGQLEVCLPYGRLQP